MSDYEASSTQAGASLEKESSNASQQFFGKYRATVINNVDPMQICRIQVIVPDVSTFVPTSWAMPCVPVAGIQMGFAMVPPMGSGVWVEFEQGDPDYPIWSGCYWGEAAEVPALLHAAPPEVAAIVLQTTLQNTLMISDVPGPTGGIMLKSTTGATLIVNDTGIYIQNGKGASLTLIGPTVTVNEGALTVI
ncbi:phage baseplate assembly protein V [Paraburkholderia silviterrae]|nr:phage baseplate assembly protein V [Paraburkholderia silviterrae]